VSDKFSAGCNRLIKTNRAALIEKLDDLEYLMGWQKSGKTEDAVQKELFVELSEEEKVLTDLLRAESKATIDHLAIHSCMQVSRVSSLLLNLEFRGIVKCLPGKVYQLTTKN
jgi:DNA processing protein